MTGALLFAGLHALLGWWIFGRLPRAPHGPGPGLLAAGGATPPQVSVIIPARDEEGNLPRLLQSLSQQDLQLCEVLVVDDQSTDGTARVAAEHGAAVIPSAPLPETWRGKPWACQQGAAQAKGDLLLFLDADTWLEPGGLRRLLACHAGGATSVVPWHEMEQAYEQLSLFFNLLMAAGSCPQSLFGQVLLIDRAAYLAAGGHETVKGRILENAWLGLHLRALGVPVRSFLGRGVARFRMYPDGIGALTAGWMKGFASGAGLTPARRMVAIVLWLSGLTVPLIGLALGAGMAAAGAMYLAAAAQVACFGRSVGGFSPGAGALYPVPLLFFFWLFAESARRRGKLVEWKGRHIHAS